ncbi:helix-turn-helix domain-containing protein [Streptomyces sp. H27-S2]|uniref:helix-turn-helix domain-containing protein n=1 Tax=Streptomyces antarcticus TaxID=2996458 RepID=UPI00226E2326|nr:helix-turn-helix transcriptional regulator [Streptomyces sp. H27-S2]MCY0954099.1 helix-turn-helix transcriptional regulator [Streptomyces sp. H27-S2]
MGRPESPVDHTLPARGALAVALRELRTAAGLSYDKLAARSGVSATALKRATSGRHVPARETVEAIAAACHAQDDEGLAQLWLDARIAERGRLQGRRRPASPELVTTPGALSQALVYFYERAGAPTLRRLSVLAGGRHLLPVSTAGRVVAGQVLPASRQQCLAFLEACGVGLRLRVRWADAYDRIAAPAPARGWEVFQGGMTAADAALRVERERHAERTAGIGSVRLADLHHGPGLVARSRGTDMLRELYDVPLRDGTIRYSEPRPTRRQRVA